MTECISGLLNLSLAIHPYKFSKGREGGNCLQMSCQEKCQVHIWQHYKRRCCIAVAVTHKPSILAILHSLPFSFTIQPLLKAQPLKKAGACFTVHTEPLLSHESSYISSSKQHSQKDICSRSYAHRWLPVKWY